MHVLLSYKSICETWNYWFTTFGYFFLLPSLSLEFLLVQHVLVYLLCDMYEHLNSCLWMWKTGFIKHLWYSWPCSYTVIVFLLHFLKHLNCLWYFSETLFWRILHHLWTQICNCILFFVWGPLDALCVL